MQSISCNIILIISIPLKLTEFMSNIQLTEKKKKKKEFRMSSFKNISINKSRKCHKKYVLIFI